MIHKKGTKTPSTFTEKEQPRVDVTVQQVGIGSIKPYHNNPRVNKDAVAYVQKSIDKFGFLVPIVVDANHTIVAGDTRYRAALVLGMTIVPVIVASHLSEAEIAAFRIADNKVSEYSSWDEEKLIMELEELEKLGFTLEDTGFDTEELDCLLTPITADCLDDLDLETVCGDVHPVTFIAKNMVRVSIGMYKFNVAIKDYTLWEKNLMQDHKGSTLDLTEVLAKKLGLPMYVNNPNDA